MLVAIAVHMICTFIDRLQPTTCRDLYHKTHATTTPFRNHDQPLDSTVQIVHEGARGSLNVYLESILQLVFTTSCTMLGTLEYRCFTAIRHERVVVAPPTQTLSLDYTPVP